MGPRPCHCTGVIQGEKYFASLGAKSLAGMRKLPAKRLLEGSAGEIAHPILDGYVLPMPPYDTFAAGKQNDVLCSLDPTPKKRLH